MNTNTTRRSKYWCWTLNNPVTPPSTNGLTYLVYGLETAPTTGTQHWQGYSEYARPCLESRVRKDIPGAHIEARFGTALEASDYCKKEGNVILEFGTLSAPVNTSQNASKKRNWALAMQLAKEGKIDDIDPSISVPHYHALKRIRQDYQKPAPHIEDVCGLWFYGPPGTGKSYTARHLYPDLYDKPANKWFDGYQGEETVLVDDFDLQHKVLGHHLKRWTDRYSFPAEHKGTTVQIRPKRVIVTSNYSIEEIFCEDDALCNALKRRFTVTEFTEVYSKQ